MRRVLAVGLTLAAVPSLLIACGASDEDRALMLVQEACEVAQPTRPGGSADVDTATETETARKYDNAANLAARAARLDDSWDGLARSYSELAELWEFAATLPEPTPEFPNRLTAQQEDRLRKYVEDAQPDERNIRAECRQATA